MEKEKEKEIVTRSYMEKLQKEVTPPINSLEEFITPPLPGNKKPVTVKHIDEIKAELEVIKSKKKVTRTKRDKRDWYGLVYCDSNGWASVIGDDCEGIWLCKTSEIIPYLKSRHINGENVDMVLQAVRQFYSKEDHKPYKRPRFFGMDGYVPLPPYNPVKTNDGKPSESKSQSYHLAINNNTPSVLRHRRKTNRITFKDDPLFLAHLDRLISKGYGIPTIQKELNAIGYVVAYATLGRWVRERREII